MCDLLIQKSLDRELIKSLQESIDDLRQKLSSKDDEISSLHQDNMGLKKQVDDLIAENVSMKEKIEEIQSSFAAMKDWINKQDMLAKWFRNTPTYGFPDVWLQFLFCDFPTCLVCVFAHVSSEI